MLWNDEPASSYVFAVIPCNALKYISCSCSCSCSGACSCSSSNLTMTTTMTTTMKMRGCYIVNCNTNSYLRGDIGHWIFLRIHDDFGLGSSLEVFDAGGEKTYNEEICMFMRQFESCSYNYQYLSNANCGFYTLACTYYRSRSFKPSTVLNKLKRIRDVKEHCLMLYSSFE